MEELGIARVNTVPRSTPEPDDGYGTTPTDDEEDWVCAWEEDWVDEDGQLWVITMLSVLVMPFYEGFHLSPILFPNLLEKITKK
jgi:hypothetical protein